MNIAYNRDCMEAMREYPDKYFDLAVVDPPYGIGVLSMTYTNEGTARVYGYSVARRRDYKQQSDWDIKPEREYFSELFRISKAQVIWGAIISAICCRPQRVLYAGTSGAATK